MIKEPYVVNLNELAQPFNKAPKRNKSVLIYNTFVEFCRAIQVTFVKP